MHTRVLTLIVATVFFALQIYCDFAGYSHIAIGTAEVMGFRLMRNFHRPYLSRSISEFWSRWHISLSTWFRDYLYIPLGGNRVPTPRWYFNLFVTFLLSGLWHGANWTFVYGERSTDSISSHRLQLRICVLESQQQRGSCAIRRVYAVWQVAATFALTCLAWVFFRAGSLDDALHVISHMLVTPTPHQILPDGLRAEGITKLEVVFSGLLIIGLMTVEVISTRIDVVGDS
jgi:D-alanyl-lipoteichoic acid acyltransferase DltB (MBOAT superfamily)